MTKFELPRSGATPRSVEVGANLLIIGGASALIFALILFAFIVPWTGDRAVAALLAISTVTFAVVCGGGPILCGIHARKGRSWPRFASALIAVTLILSVRDQWFILIAVACVVLATILLWLPAARSYSRGYRKDDDGR
ncbi:hypothetical protein [Agromyces sp. PvR057]|uniref:hypothetical protein n=1 Tax=Agromyces sp. PvR057 TaxID=3156403 RepID=UPI0033963DB0